MKDLPQNENTALVGVSFSTKVIYNIVTTEGEFHNTGRSIINFLNNNKNRFISDVILSQNFQGIKLLLDDSMIFEEEEDKSNSNMSDFKELSNYMNEQNEIDNFYIYDVIEDLLFIKLGDKELIGLDYKNSQDVRKFINNIN